MKLRNTLEDLNALVDSIKEHNKPILEKQVDEIVKGYEGKEAATLAEEANKFSEELEKVKKTFSDLMSSYIQGRQEYASSKMKAKFSGIFSPANKPKDKTSSSNSINYSSESQSSQTVLARNDYQDAFSKMSTEQYSLNLYEKIKKLIDQMTDYDTTVTVTFEMAALLTKENKVKSENLYKTVQKITDELMKLIDYKFNLQVVKLHEIMSCYSPSTEVIRSQDLRKTVIKRLRQERVKTPALIITYNNLDFERYHIYGNNGNEWPITDLDKEAIMPFREALHGVVDADIIPDTIYREILAKKGHIVTNKFKRMDMKKIRESELTIVTERMELEINQTLESYIANFYFLEFLPKNPNLGSFDSELRELRLAKKPDINEEVFESKKQAAMTSATKLGPQFIELVENDDNNRQRIAVISDGKFIEPLCQMLESRYVLQSNGPSSKRS